MSGAIPVVFGWLGIFAGMVVLPPLQGAMAGCVLGGVVGFALLLAWQRRKA